MQYWLEVGYLLISSKLPCLYTAGLVSHDEPDRVVLLRLISACSQVHSTYLCGESAFTATTSEEMAQTIANLKGKELEEYIADAEEVLKLINKRLQDHNPKMIQAHQEMKAALEGILKFIEPNRSN
jgi:hypothetical protein